MCAGRQDLCHVRDHPQDSCLHLALRLPNLIIFYCDVSRYEIRLSSQKFFRGNTEGGSCAAGREDHAFVQAAQKAYLLPPARSRQ
jgi:hypothetical protein